MAAATGPLAGIRIVEIDAIGPVPLAAMLLADMGAEIVRVARPPSAGAGAWDDVGGDILHRSRAVTYLNLKDDADREPDEVRRQPQPDHAALFDEIVLALENGHPHQIHD